MTSLKEKIARIICKDDGHNPDSTSEMHGEERMLWAFYVQTAEKVIRETLEHYRDNVSSGMKDAARNVEPLHSGFDDIISAALSQAIAELD